MAANIVKNQQSIQKPYDIAGKALAVKPPTFISGLSKSPTDLQAFKEAGHNHFGLVMPDIRTANKQRQFQELANSGNQLFIDSGAFGGADFNQLMADYKSFISGITRGEHRFMMPDVVGDQGKTLELLNKHEKDIKELQKNKYLSPVFALQVGNLTAARWPRS